jgi:hypothetical protein
LSQHEHGNQEKNNEDQVPHIWTEGMLFYRGDLLNWCFSHFIFVFNVSKWVSFLGISGRAPVWNTVFYTDFDETTLIYITFWNVRNTWKVFWMYIFIYKT